MPTRVARARAPRGDTSGVAIDRSSDAIARHLEDAAHFPGGRADGVARPRSEAEVADAIRVATHVLPIGAQSSVTGGATPSGGLVLSTERLLSFQEAGRDRIRAGSGLSLDRLQELLSPAGRWYAPFPTFTGATIGGIVATNAAGAATFKYGTTRAWVEGLTIVLACGCVLDLERHVVHADAGEGFELICTHGNRSFRPGRYVLPDVPKCSAGYYAAPGMDLIDLFVGSEGTLGIVVDATLRVLPVKPALALALVPVQSERAGLALVRELRDAARATWESRDAKGIDIAAIEHLDRRVLELIREDGVDRKLDIDVPPETDLLLLVQIELPPGLSSAEAYEQIGAEGDDAAGDTALGRFCRVLRAHDAFENAEIALADNTRRVQQMLAFRESAPTGVNHRVAQAKRLDARIDKTAADMVVPFAHFETMMAIYHDGYERRGLDYAIWGHISDGNVHPNVIPRSYEDVIAGRDAILEFGREVARLGGSPLAEHGVGRSALKQTLLRVLYGDGAIDDMRAIKRALDPEWKLSPGVLFSADLSSSR